MDKFFHIYEDIIKIYYIMITADYSMFSVFALIFVHNPSTCFLILLYFRAVEDLGIANPI